MGKDDDYEVTKILDVKGSGRNRMYLVEWSNSWVPEKDLNCKQLIADFNKSRENSSGMNEQNGDDSDSVSDSDDKDEKSKGSKGKGRKRGRPSVGVAKKGT